MTARPIGAAFQVWGLAPGAEYAVIRSYRFTATGAKIVAANNQWHDAETWVIDARSGARVAEYVHGRRT